MQICEAGSRVLTLGAAACCRGSAAAAALREFLPALVLFNYNTPVAGPEMWGSPPAHPQCQVDFGGWKSCVCCSVHLTVLPSTSCTQIWSGHLRKDKCCNCHPWFHTGCFQNIWSDCHGRNIKLLFKCQHCSNTLKTIDTVSYKSSSLLAWLVYTRCTSSLDFL